MRLREHPKIQWPPRWGESSLRGRPGDFARRGPYRIAEASSKQRNGRKVYFAEIYCFNSAFASRLHEKIKPIVGRPIREVAELDF
jgi:hypothetical protein